MKNKLEITLNGIEWNDEFTIKFNNDIAKLTATKDTCAFYFDEQKKYELEIIQEKSRKLHIWEIIMCCIFALVQGLFYILTFHSDEKWYESISKYRVKNKVHIFLQSNTKLVFKIQYGDVKEMPVIKCNHQDKIIHDEEVYYPNERAAKLAFFHHFRKISAIFTYLYVFLIAMGMSAYRTEKLGLLTFSTLLFIVFAVLHVCIYMKDKNRLK